MSEKTKILNETQIQQKIKRLAFEVYENTFTSKNLLLGGIEGNGYEVAKLLEKTLHSISEQKIELFTIHIDKKNPFSSVETKQKDDYFTEKSVVLIDDVINSGKTMMQAASHLTQYELSILKTAVLVDRKHRIYPIKADFVGLSLSTTLQDHIQVELTPKPGVFLM